MDYPNDDTVKFIFISRIMKQKGIEQYLDTAIAIREEYPNTEFHILGYCEDAYREKLKKLNNNKTIIYHGMTSDVRPFYCKRALYRSSYLLSRRYVECSFGKLCEWKTCHHDQS